MSKYDMKSAAILQQLLLLSKFSINLHYSDKFRL